MIATLVSTDNTKSPIESIFSSISSAALWSASNFAYAASAFVNSDKFVIAAFCLSVKSS